MSFHYGEITKECQKICNVCVLYIKFLSFLKANDRTFLGFLIFWSIGILLIFMNKILASFIIDISRCCFCEFCVEECPILYWAKNVFMKIFID